MFSRITLRLIDTAILPSLLVFGVKFSAVVLLALYWKFPLELGSAGLNFRNFSDLYKVNLFSNIVLFSFTFTALFLSLIRSYFLTAENLTPSLSAKLAGLDLSRLPLPLGQSYMRSLVWLTLSFSVTLSLFIQGLFDLSSFYLSAFSGASLVLGLFIFLLCLERDAHAFFGKDSSVVISGKVSDA